MTTRADIVAAARSYKGVPYHHQGRNRAGLDCIGLVLVVGWDLGLTALDYDGYGTTPDGRMMRAELEKHMRRIPVAEAQPGDVLLMRWESDPRHLAIVIELPEGPAIIHAHNRKSNYSVVEHVIDATWRARTVAAYAWPGVVA